MVNTFTNGKFEGLLSGGGTPEIASMVNLLHQLTTDLAECESQASPGPPDLGKGQNLDNSGYRVPDRKQYQRLVLRVWIKT